MPVQFWHLCVPPVSGCHAAHLLYKLSVFCYSRFSTRCSIERDVSSQRLYMACTSVCILSIWSIAAH